MKDITKWWLDYMPLSEKEQKLITQIRTSSPILGSDEEFNLIEKEYFNRMPYCNISENTHHLTFSDCATNFINGLFDKYVDDETLVLYTNNEHDNVKKNLQKCKNTLEVEYYPIIKPLKLQNIINECKKYKKVFVYMIGTQISTGEITPQIFFEKLKQQLVYNKIDHTIVLDDVHGMFLVPRDYSLFDYIIYTAHALIKHYDMGIMISKDRFMGIQAINWGKEYLEMLDVVLKRKEKLRIFPYVMKNEFYEILLNEGFGICEDTSPQIFSLKTNNIFYTKKMYDILDSYEVRVEGMEHTNKYLRFRAQQFIQYPENLNKGLEVVYNILSSANITNNDEDK